ncbi:hypothetical protein O4H66_14550 [Comamonadaceae bacterium G21597-S1]|nr:hypothetical protein [Comamonadaceae bacterium G21597-S1]
MVHPAAHIIAERDYPAQLLETAGEMIERGRYEVSVVTSQMACEISVERVLRAYFKHQPVMHLESAIEDLLPSYNLANDKVRNLYTALTNDRVSQAHFWSEYKTVVSIRNKAVHAGMRVQESQAQLVLRVCILVVKHLGRVALEVPLPAAKPSERDAN